MIETFSALLFAHVLADFVFQTEKMALGKRDPRVLGLHAAIVLIVSIAAIGPAWPFLAAPPWWPPLLVLALAHLLTDLAKARFGTGLSGFLADQAVHLVTLLAVAVWRPDLWDTGLWSALLPDEIATALPVAMAWLAGFILAVRAGGFAVGALLTPFTHGESARIIAMPASDRAGAPRPDGTHSLLLGGLPDAGRMIGMLERGVTYLLVMSGHPSAVAFLVAAKSILRFNTSKDDRAMAEYVIVGTLASVGWALIVAFGAQILIDGLGWPAP